MKILLVGKSGLAKDLLTLFKDENYIRKITLFDNVSNDGETLLYNFFRIITELDELKDYFQNESKYFITAIGSPRRRKEISAQLEAIGGINFSYINSKSSISPFAEISDNGVIIQVDCQVSSSVVIEDGVFLNVRCMVGHDCYIGKYTTLSPDVKLLGNVKVGENCVLATGVTVMPNITIGDNVKVGMNKLVTEDLSDNTILI